MSAASIEQLRQVASEIFRAHPVSLAYLYGSQATGRATPLSDVDVAVMTDEKLPPRERLRLELTMERELAAACGGDFDVRIVSDAPLTVKATVIQTGTLLYSRDEARRVEFEATVRDLYFDFLPVVRLHRHAYFAAQRAALQERGLL